ncbi:hypothetical protein BS47DRAFT_1415837, partial [Hydnum rufescens UP504]
GTAADTEFTTAVISSNIELRAWNSRRKSRVVMTMTTLRQYISGYQGASGAALVLGGVESTGVHLFIITPHGAG